MKFLFLLLLPFGAIAETWEKIDHVLDGDTFVTASGETVRLLGINTPEPTGGKRPGEEGGDEASAYAKQWLTGKNVRLVTQETPRDRYGRLLAHAYLKDGTWVNGHLIATGLAHVYSFADNRALIRDLLILEHNARQAGKGLWASPRWQPRQAETCCQREDIGYFHLVQGTVKHTAVVRGTTYLNFGADWKTDFTVEIRKDDLPLFTEAGIDPGTFYAGKTLLVRGPLKPVNGVLVTVTHPEGVGILPLSPGP
jgi:endonuclease YncB( thermonuclease family)